MFSKAKLKRFNEEIGCAPPPTKYNPKLLPKPTGSHFDKGTRWTESKQVTPGPTTYCGPVLRSFVTPSRTPWTVSSSGLNSTSSSSGGLPSFGHHFMRSNSVRSSTKGKASEAGDLKEKVELLQKEKESLRVSVEQLELQLTELKSYEMNSTRPLPVRELCSSAVQVNLSDEVEKETDGVEDANDKETCAMETIKKEDLQLLRDQINHLTSLRDNLEASIATKDEAITDLQMQIDLVVAEAEESHEEREMYKEEVKRIRVQLESTFGEKNAAECRVKDLIAKYEALVSRQREDLRHASDAIAQKDIEIELLNDSIATLNTQVSEFEKTFHRIQSDVSLKKSQISSLELMIGDLSMASKQKEVMEAVLEDEIKEKNWEVTEMEEKLSRVTSERDQLLSLHQTEYAEVEQTQERVKDLELNLKEKEVLQQFLEKEMASREAEVTEANRKISFFEAELTTARRIALDLQEEAEVQLNEMIGLKATLSVKNFDLESKDDLIFSLKEEANLNETASNELKEKIVFIGEMKKEMEGKSSYIRELEEEIGALKSSLKEERKNASELEGRICEIDDRENEHKNRIRETESEIEDLSVKYSESLLELEATKRLLNLTSGNLEKESLLLQATERELHILLQELSLKGEENSQLESSVKELTHKLVHIEDALACEEAAANEALEQLRTTTTSSQKVIEALTKEKAVLLSSTEGYTAQIAQLKIDMTKKSVAVEDMQFRIENLRDEKNILLEKCHTTESKLVEKDSMLKDLQDEFESRLKIIADLQAQASQSDREMIELRKGFEERLKDMSNDTRDLEEMMGEALRDLKEKVDDKQTKIDSLEEENSNLLHRVSHSENHLKEQEKETAEYIEKVLELENKVSILENEKSGVVEEMGSQMEREKGQVKTLGVKLEALQQMYVGYEDQLINMQTSLLDKTSEAERFEQNCLESNLRIQTYKEKLEDLQSNVNRQVQELEQLNSLLVSNDTLLTSLNESMSVKSDEIIQLQKNLEEKQKQFEPMEKRLADLEMTIDVLRAEKEEALSRAYFLQEFLDGAKEEASRLSETRVKDVEARMGLLKTHHQQELAEFRRLSQELKGEVQSWKSKYEQLYEMVSPFKKQLNAYQVEKDALLSKSEADHEMISKLSGDYAKLLGHHNHKQKIHHVIKLKAENSDLREKVHLLQMEVEGQKKAFERLEGSCSRRSKTKIDMGDKENSLYIASKSHSDLSQRAPTPHKSANRYRRL